MDQVKIGSYIAKKRRELGLTQKELAELIDVTDKSVSKWERGYGLPDVLRLRPLCDALKVSMNDLLAGEDITEEAFSEKMEENIMSLMKENETHKRNGKLFYVGGAVLALITLGLLGISLEGSSIYSVAYYLDPPSLLFVLLFIGIGVMLSKDKSKSGIWKMVQKMSIPASGFIAVFSAILFLNSLEDVSRLGPNIAVILITILYGIIIYIISTIVITHMD